jgi:hypothetical protein
MKIKVCMKINSQKDNANNHKLGLFEVKTRVQMNRNITHSKSILAKIWKYS